MGPINRKGACCGLFVAYILSGGRKLRIALLSEDSQKVKILLCL